MVPIRKARAGSSNLGYTWPEDGSVVDVEPEHAPLLLAVPDGEFTVVDDAPADEAHADPEPEPKPEPVDRTIEEPAPAAELSEAPAPRKTAAKKTAAKKAAADPESASTVEE